MTRVQLILILTVFTFAPVLGQNRIVSCDCPKTQFAGTKADTTFHLSNSRTIALCGGKKARQYFEEFKTKFGTLDGAFAEEYRELKAMLELWDRKK